MDIMLQVAVLNYTFEVQLYNRHRRDVAGLNIKARKPRPLGFVSFLPSSV